MQKNKSKKNNYSTIQLFSYSAENGYTIIEMLAVLAIVAVLSTVILTNYTKNRQSEILLNETYKISQLIRRAQNLALSPQYGGGVINGFGVYLLRNNSNVILFANKDANNVYNSGVDEIKETLILNSMVKIPANSDPDKNGLNAPIGINRTSLNILYIPPDPEVKITGGSTDAKIRIEIVGDASKFRTIEVNATGLVEVK